MRKSGWFAIVVSALATAAFAGDGIVHHMPEKVPNQYVVMMVPGHDVKALSNELAAAHAGRVAAVQEHLGTFTLTLPNEKAAEHVARDPRIAYVQEDGILHLMDCRPLSSDGSQWALGFLNTFGQKSRFGDSIGAYLNNVQLYVLDTPINTANGDFSGKRVNVYNASDPLCTGSSPGHTPIGGGNQAYGSYDPNHGGKVASIIVGNTHGVLSHMQSLTSVVVFNTSVCADDTAFNNAANYVIHSQQQLQGMGMPGVANLSFGTPGVIDAALNNGVTQMIGAGTFVTAAAGNDSQPASLGSPSDLAPYPGMLSVGATNIYGSAASYSNYGSGVDIWAPGGENPLTGGTGVMTCDGYDAGTSYAATGSCRRGDHLFLQVPVRDSLFGGAANQVRRAVAVLPAESAHSRWLHLHVR